jgi:excisionase family DNA binding protein
MLPLLTQVEAARLTSVSERTLERLRVSGGGPRFVRIGRRVLYRLQDLETFIADRVVSNTSQNGGHHG